MPVPPVIVTENLDDTYTTLEFKKGGEQVKYSWDAATPLMISTLPGTSVSITTTQEEFASIQLSFRKWLTTLVRKYGAPTHNGVTDKLTYDNSISGLHSVTLSRGGSSVIVFHNTTTNDMTLAYNPQVTTFPVPAGIRGIFTVLSWTQRGFTPFCEEQVDIINKVFIANT